MRSSNSRDKPSSTTYSQSSQNRLMKTQLPPKTNPKQSLNSTQYKLPPSTPSIKRIQSSKSTNVSTKQIPKQDVNFDIENNMTESKIITAKESLQLLKKKMNRTGMSREKITTSGQSSQNIPPQMKTQYAPDSMKKIKSDSNKNIQNYQAPQNNKKYQQEEYEPQSYKAPSKKTLPPQQQQKPQRTLQKKTTLPPQKNQSHYNQAEQVPIVKKQTFEEMLERELRKEQAAKKMENNSNTFGKKPQQQSYQQPSEYPEESGELFECSKGCGRQFNANVIAKHEKICEKVFQQKRKVFNTAAQRQVETQGFNKPPQFGNQTNQTKKQPQKPAQNKNKVPKWKLQSAQLRVGLKAMNNQPPSKEQQALVNMQKDQLVQCNYCGRKFNETAAKRHIPVCGSKAKQMPRTSNATAKKR